MYHWTPTKGAQGHALRSITPPQSVTSIRARGWTWTRGHWSIPAADAALAAQLGAAQASGPSLSEPAGYDLLNRIADLGGIQPRPAAPRYGDSRWDDAPTLRGVHARLWRDRGLPPDVLASTLAGEHYLAGDHPGDLWAGIIDAIDARRRARAAAAQERAESEEFIESLSQ